MKYPNLIKISVLLYLMTFTIGCKKEINYVGIQGELRGRVRSNDGLSLKNVLVSLTGGISRFETRTDDNGLYVFENLKTGIYDIDFTKDSFALFKFQSFQFIGGNLPTYTQPVYLYKFPPGLITNITADTDSSFMPYSFTVRISGTVTDTTSTSYYAQYYISNQSDVSSSKYQITEYITRSKYQSDTLFVQDLNMRVFSNYKPGEKLFIIFYKANFNQMGPYSYLDTETGNEVYTYISKQGSNVAEFTLPSNEVRIK